MATLTLLALLATVLLGISHAAGGPTQRGPFACLRHGLGELVRFSRHHADVVDARWHRATR